MTGYIGNTSYAKCEESLSGEVSATNEDKAIHYSTLEQNNNNGEKNAGF